MPSIDLNNKRAVITGAASGIGLAIAQRYVAAGGKVAIADLNAEAAANAAAAINAATPGSFAFVEIPLPPKKPYQQ